MHIDLLSFIDMQNCLTVYSLYIHFVQNTFAMEQDCYKEDIFCWKNI